MDAQWLEQLLSEILQRLDYIEFKIQTLTVHLPLLVIKA